MTPPTEATGSDVLVSAVIWLDASMDEVILVRAHRQNEDDDDPSLTPSPPSSPVARWLSDRSSNSSKTAAHSFWSRWHMLHTVGLVASPETSWSLLTEAFGSLRTAVVFKGSMVPAQEVNGSTFPGSKLSAPESTLLVLLPEDVSG